MTDAKLTHPDFIIDPVNPSKEELEKWAYGNYYQPEQDFELFVVDDPELILEFASDPKCPTRDFFLGSLYVWSGDTVKNTDSDMSKLEKLLQVAAKKDDERIRKYVERSRTLLANPESYTYAKYDNWASADSAEELNELAKRIVEASEEIKLECEHLGIPYFDLSTDYESTIQKAFNSLVV